ncbi:MAG: MATE family efflux transporter [Mobilitalea sp.]
MNMLNGNIRKTIIKFAIPMILSLITQQLYNVVDMIIVGRFLGINELAAVGNAGTLVSILVALSGGLEMGSEVIFARYLGGKKYADIVQGVRSILLFGLISGLCISVVGILLQKPILSWIKVPDYLAADTGIYISIYIAGLAGIFLYDISRAIIVALGDARGSMILLIFTSFLNVCLDLLFICIFHWGVAGAAIATILSQIIGMFIVLLMVKKKLAPYVSEYKVARFQIDKIKEILTISVPTIIQQLILSFSAVLLLSVVNPYGSEVISGYMAVNKIMLFGMLIIIGTSQALSIFTASNLGAGQTSRIREAYRVCMIFTTIYVACIAILNFLIPQYLVGIFIDTVQNPKAYLFAKEYLQFSFFTYFFFGWKIINENLLRGFVKMKEYLFSNISELFIKLFLTYLFVIPFSLHAFWMGNMLGKLVSFAISMIVIYKGHLFTKKLSA